MKSIQNRSRIQVVINSLIFSILLMHVNTVIMSVASAQDDDLSVEIQADLIMKSAQKNTVEEKWAAAVVDFEKLIKLRAVLPVEFSFHYAEALFKVGKYDNSLVNLKKYIKTVGRDGANYNDALDLVIGVKEKKTENEAKKELAERFLKELNKDMVLVNGSCFMMGDNFGDGDSNEQPVHEVCVDDFYVGKHEISVSAFRDFVKETGYETESNAGDGMPYFADKEWKEDHNRYWDKPGFSQTNIHPIVGVSWYDTQEYINWLNYKTGMNFRLPTEAEWEYAARSGGKKEKWAGTSNEAELGRYTWYEGNSGKRTHPVGQKEPNGLGLYDMSGNAWEWVEDWYVKDYYEKSPEHNPKGSSTGIHHVIRGGSWSSFPRFMRASHRLSYNPDHRDACLGFRLARTP